MASGIVSIDLSADHRAVLSAITLWFALLVWVLLAVLLGVRLAYHRDRFAREACSPGAFTGAAGTAVLGTRLASEDYHAGSRGAAGGVGGLLGLACDAGPAALEDPDGRDLLCPDRRHRSTRRAGSHPGGQLPCRLACQRRDRRAGSRARLLRLHRRPVRPPRPGHRARRPLDCRRRAGHLCPRRRPRHPSRSCAWAIKQSCTSSSRLARWCSGAWPWCGSSRWSRARSSGRGSATTRAAGAPSFRSAFTPRAASSRARSPASARSPTSVKLGRGSRSPAWLLALARLVRHGWPVLRDLPAVHT